ncbi:MAG: hypothetical protein Q4E98_06210 [Acidaminococcaceae bacterium]|nr:hypothetical protein [Acidaminococcaceae bacterium]
MKEFIKAFCDRYFNERDRHFFLKGIIVGAIVGTTLGFILKAVVF